MTTELEMDPKAPFPKVQWYYDVKVKGLQNHDFGTEFIDLRISFNNELEDEPLLLALQILFKILNNIYMLLIRNADGKDLVRIVLTSDQISYPIEVPFLMKVESSVKCIMDQVKRVLQSYRDFWLDGNVKINFIHQPITEHAAGWNPTGKLTKRKEAQI